MNVEGNEKFEDSNTYLFMEEVTEDSCKDLVSWILEKNHQSRDSTLNLIICSPGGELLPCFGVLDAMKLSPIPIHTKAIGLVASCGLLIAMTGDKRVVSKNCSIMSHQFTGFRYGKQHELLSSRKQEDMLIKKLTDHYQFCTSLPRSVISSELLGPTDIWLSPEEAIKYNLFDEVIG